MLESVYRKAAVSFFLLTAILLLLVAYVVLPKVVVTVKVESVPIVRNFEFSISASEEEKDSNALLGGFTEVEVIQEKSFPATGKKKLSKDIRGNITIKNTYTGDQTLVATTRFITSDGSLLRLSKTVVVPKGGEVAAEVYLDKESGGIEEIKAGKLIIPGLWEGLQDKIYGVVETPLTGTTEEFNIVSESDVENAVKELKDSIEKTGRDLLKQKFSLSENYSSEILSSLELIGIRTVEDLWEAAPTIGEEGERFLLRGRVTLEGVFYVRDEGSGKFKTRLEESVSGDESVTFEQGTTSVAILEALDGGEGSVLISWQGKSFPKDMERRIIEKNLKGLSLDKAEGVIKGISGVKEAKVFLSPFWVKRVPKRIDIVVINE